MNLIQIVTIVFLLLSALCVIVSIVWTVTRAQEANVEISFAEIKEGVRAKKWNALAPIWLGIVGIYSALSGVAFVLFAFAQWLVGLLWLGAVIYALVQTIRSFRRA